MIDPDSPFPLIILVFLLALHTVIAAARAAITSLRRSRQLQLIEEGNTAAEMVERLSNDATHLILTERLSIKIIELLFISLAVLTYAPSLSRILPTDNILIAVMIIVAATSFVLLFVGELIPREIGRNYAEPAALWLIYPIYLLSLLTVPLARALPKVGIFLGPNSVSSGEEYGLDVITEDDLRTYMDASEEGGVLKEDEKEMIYSIFNLDVLLPSIWILNSCLANEFIRKTDE